MPVASRGKNVQALLFHLRGRRATGFAYSPETRMAQAFETRPRTCNRALS